MGLPARTRTLWRRGFGERLAIIVAAGLLIRLIYVLVVSRHTVGTGDSSFFHGLANLLAEGRGFTNPFGVALDGRITPTALHPPLFPLVLAAESKLGASSYLAHRLLGCGLGALTLAALGLLGRRVGGERAGLLAAGLGAAYCVLIGADGAVMSETLFGLLVATVLLAALRLREPPELRRALTLGALAGLAALTRAEGLALLVLVLPPFAGGRVGTRRRAALAGVAVLAAAAVISPWAVRNAVAFHRFVPLSNNDGTLLAGANCGATYAGVEIGFWEFRCVPSPGSQNEAEAAASSRRRGLRYAGDHGGALPKVLAVRLLRTWDLYQPLRMTRAAEGRRRGVDLLGVLQFYALVPLAVAGALTLRRRSRPLAPLLVPVALTMLVSLLGYGIPRFRQPGDIVLVVLAAVALDQRLSKLAAQDLARLSP